MATFCVPTRLAGLQSADAAWRVKTVHDTNGSRLRSSLEDAAGKLEDDCCAVREHDVFDPVFSVLINFDQTNSELRDLACQLAMAAVRTSAHACKSGLAGLSSDAELEKRRQGLVMASFLLGSFIVEAEKSKSKAVPSVSGGAKSKKGVKKITERLEDAVWDWDSVREAAALRLLEALELDLSTLWGHRQPDDAFLMLFSRAAYASIEQAAVAKNASAAFKDALWRLISIPAVRHEQSVSTVSSLVHLLLTHDHLASPMAELMHHLLEEHEAPRLVGELLRELSELAPAEMGADAAGPKNVAAFMAALAGRTPLMLLANIQMLLSLLAADSYTLRCGVVSAFGQLQVHASRMQTPPTEVREACEGLVQMLVERLHDTSSFVRYRVLSTMVALCEARALPAADFVGVVEAGLERLHDKNANVRRGALQLYAKALEFNPFCPSFDRAALQQRRAVLAPPTSASTEGASTPQAGESGTTDASVAAAPKDAASPFDAEVSAAVRLLEDALRLEAIVRSHLPIVSQLLGSQTNSDILEAMSAMVAAHSFGIFGARPAAFLTLVWSREPNVKQAALDAAQAVWLRPAETSARKAAAATSSVKVVARGLMALTEDLNLAELTSLEEVVAEWQRQQALPTSVYTILWDTVQGKCADLRDRKHQRAALALLNMAAVADAGLLTCKMDVIMQQLRGDVDFEVARHACLAMQICAGNTSLSSKVVRVLLGSLDGLLVTAPTHRHDRLWFSTAEQAINTAFSVHPAPERWSTELIHRMAAKLFPTVVDDSAQAAAIAADELARFLFVLGHIAIKTLAHVEACEKALCKQRHALLDMQNGDAEPTARKQKKPKDAAGEVADADSLAQELGTAAAQAEADSERLLAVGEEMLQPDGLLGSWAPLLISVCSNTSGAYGGELRASGTLALCKFMCCSATFCEEQLQLLFTIIQREPETAVRTNIAVALGDLVVRHPNQLEPWTAHLYRQLRDTDARVRKSAIMVLTHLILNDMVKVKGQVSEMALCLLDDDDHIRALTRLFFTEFAKKGSAPVYNLLPDIVSALSTDSNVGPDAFREIVGFLIAFIQKERQTEVMVEKLCLRFGATDDTQRHRDIAFCISSLTHTERSVRKLQEHFKTYADKLVDDEIFASFSGVVQRARKFARPELKAALEEYEAQIEAKHLGEAAGQEACDRGGASAVKQDAAARARKASTKQRRRRKLKADESSADDAGEADAEEEAEADENVAPNTATRPGVPRKSSSRPTRTNRQSVA